MTIPSLLAAALLLSAAPAAYAQEAHTIRIATEGAYPPFNFVNPDGSVGGLDVDIAKAICAAMEATCTIAAQDWDGLIPALREGRFDAVVASMTITAERKQLIDFTDRYYATPLALVVRKDSGIATLAPEALKGRSIGAQAASVIGTYAEEHFAPAGAVVNLYPSQQDASADLVGGRLDALITDRFAAYDWMKGDGRECCRLIGDLPDSETEAGIALRKGDPLKDRFNEALRRIRANGTYRTIVAKYFPFDID